MRAISVQFASFALSNLKSKCARSLFDNASDMNLHANCAHLSIKMFEKECVYLKKLTRAQQIALTALFFLFLSRIRGHKVGEKFTYNKKNVHVSRTY